jgi:hypothetical protein
LILFIIAARNLEEHSCFLSLPNALKVHHTLSQELAG